MIRVVLLWLMMVASLTLATGCMLAETAFITLHTRHDAGPIDNGYESGEQNYRSKPVQPPTQSKKPAPDVPVEATRSSK